MRLIAQAKGQVLLFSKDSFEEWSSSLREKERESTGRLVFLTVPFEVYNFTQDIQC
jgi:hypothetical protein